MFQNELRICFFAVKGLKKNEGTQFYVLLTKRDFFEYLSEKSKGGG